MASKKPSKPLDVQRLVADALVTLNESDVIKLTALGPKAARGDIAEQLKARGFEVTKSVVRRPLMAQLAAALNEGRPVPLKGIATFVHGGSPAELKAVVGSAMEQGLALRVLRGNAEVLVPKDSDVLTKENLLTVRRGLDGLAKRLAKAAKQRSTSLLLEDVTDDLQTLLHGLPTGSKRTAGSGNATDMDDLLKALDATTDASVGLSFIPSLASRLPARSSPDRVKALLLEAAGQGLIELRPEGGLNRLSAEERALCPEGPQGTRLSWARRLAQGLS
jgi:hypothetical protein